jgi:hypothetical protein
MSTLKAKVNDVQNLTQSTCFGGGGKNGSGAVAELLSEETQSYWKIFGMQLQHLHQQHCQHQQQIQ